MPKSIPLAVCPSATVTVCSRAGRGERLDVAGRGERLDLVGSRREPGERVVPGGVGHRGRVGRRDRQRPAIQDELGDVGLAVSKTSPQVPFGSVPSTCAGGSAKKLLGHVGAGHRVPVDLGDRGLRRSWSNEPTKCSPGLDLEEGRQVGDGQSDRADDGHRDRVGAVVRQVHRHRQVVIVRLEALDLAATPCR